MMAWHQGRLYANGHSYHVTIPDKFRRFLKWNEGEELILTLDEKRVLVIVSLDDYVASKVHEQVHATKGAAAVTS